jgi:hypothetical protein
VGDDPVSQNLSSRTLRTALVAIAITGFMALFVGGADAAWRLGRSAYYCILRSEVQDSRGAPRTGKDPALQRQTRLAAAARAPKGSGTWGGAPARSVGSGAPRRRAASVLADPKSTGALASGCAVGYGAAGAQCVPARRPGNRPLTCTYLVTQFPDGVTVTGRDRLHLDPNHDGLACGHGDRGVPAAYHHGSP